MPHGVHSETEFLGRYDEKQEGGEREKPHPVDGGGGDRSLEIRRIAGPHQDGAAHGGERDQRKADRQFPGQQDDRARPSPGGRGGWSRPRRCRSRSSIPRGKERRPAAWGPFHIARGSPENGIAPPKRASAAPT